MAAEFVHMFGSNDQFSRFLVTVADLFIWGWIDRCCKPGQNIISNLVYIIG